MKPTGLPEEPENADRWVVSYADFITLLFAFFVVMYAISAVDARRLRAVSAGIRGAFVASPVEDAPIPLHLAPSGAHGSQEGGRLAAGLSGGESTLTLGELEQRFRLVFAHRGVPKAAAANVRLRREDRGLVVSLGANTFFAPGSDELRPQAGPLLDSVAAVLAGLDAPLRVEGHTDDRPVHGGRFPSNWELSAARATRIARYLIDRGGIEPERLAVVGYAQYRPVVANDTPEHRALNRRVDLVVLSPQAAAAEPASRAKSALERAARRKRALTRVLDRLRSMERAPNAETADEAAAAR